MLILQVVYYYFLSLIKKNEVPQPCLTFCNPMDCSLPCSSIHGIFPGKSTGVGCHFLLQGIFPTQGLNSGFPHCRQILYHLSHLKLEHSLLISTNPMDKVVLKSVSFLSVFYLFLLSLILFSPSASLAVEYIFIWFHFFLCQMKITFYHSFCKYFRNTISLTQSKLIGTYTLKNEGT